MPSTSYLTLMEAIRDHHQVFCRYGNYEREICPHILGLKNGKEHLLSFQFGGGSSQPLPIGGEWRCMDVAQVSNIRVRTGDWHSATMTPRNRSCVDVIQIEVTPE